MLMLAGCQSKGALPGSRLRAEEIWGMGRGPAGLAQRELEAWLTTVDPSAWADAGVYIATSHGADVETWSHFYHWIVSVDPLFESEVWRVYGDLANCAKMPYDRESTEELVRIARYVGGVRLLRVVRELGRRRELTPGVIAIAKKWADGLMRGVMSVEADSGGYTLQIDEPVQRRVGSAIVVTLHRCGIQLDGLGPAW